jgi:Transposase DDE domain
MPPARAGPCPRTWSRGAAVNDKNPAARLGREGLGRSRGGLSTKIHLAADRRCRPVARILSPGQHGDCPRFIPLMQAVRIARRGLGRPRTRPGAAMGDKAYSSAANRAYLRKRGIKAVIPVEEDQKKHRRGRGRAGGRAARLRRRTLQGAQHRRALFRQAQAVPCRRDPLRQARVHVPGHRRRRVDPDLAAGSRPMIHRTRLVADDGGRCKDPPPDCRRIVIRLRVRHQERL